MRKYSVDDSFLDVIDTEEKAYFLGFLYADGNNGKNSVIALKLQEQDKHILEELKILIKSTYPLYYLNLNKKNPRHKNTFNLSFRSHKMAKRLTELGCPPRKSLILKFPTEEQVPNHLLRHFIRGMFDGDGNVSIILQKSKERTSWSKFSRRFPDLYSNIFSTIFFCNELQIKLRDIGISSCVHKKAKTSAFIAMNGNESGIKFLDWIYDNCKIKLKRKYEKYMFMKFLLLNKNYRFLDNIEPFLDFTGYY